MRFAESKDSFKVQNIIANRRRGNPHNDFYKWDICGIIS